MSSGTRNTNIIQQEDSLKSWKILGNIAIIFGILSGSDVISSWIIGEENRGFRILTCIGLTVLICIIIFYAFSKQYQALSKKLYQKSKKIFYIAIIILIGGAFTYFVFSIGQYFPKTNKISVPLTEKTDSRTTDTSTLDVTPSSEENNSTDAQTLRVARSLSSDDIVTKPNTPITITTQPNTTKTKTDTKDNKKYIIKSNRPKIKQEAIDEIQPENGFIFIGTYSKTSNRFVKFKLTDSKKRDLNTLMNVKEINIRTRSSVYKNKPNKEPKTSNVIYVAAKNTELEVLSVSIAYSTKGLDYYYAEIKFKQ